MSGSAEAKKTDWESVIERMNDETEKLSAQAEQWKRDDARFLNKLMGSISDFRRAEKGFGRLEVEPHTPLTLEQAACLPIFGGQLYYNVDVSIPGPNVSEKTLRNAVNKGLLGTTSTNSKNKTTLAQIEEWLEACRSKSTMDRTSSSATPALRVVSSPTVALTSSRTSSTEKTSVSTQDAVSEMLKKLR